MSLRLMLYARKHGYMFYNGTVWASYLIEIKKEGYILVYQNFDKER